MKMRIKTLTKDCKKCGLMDKELKTCAFGNSKVPKVLRKPKGKTKKCNLIKGLHDVFKHDGIPADIGVDIGFGMEKNLT